MGQGEVLEAVAVPDIQADEAGHHGGPRGPAMISRDDVEKLRRLHAQGPDVLSLYLPVPLEADGVLTLPARARDLIVAARAVGPDAVSTSQVGDTERDAVLDAVRGHGRHWLGSTVAIFASRQLGLFEVHPLPCALPERSVLATRPHVRPLLAALQRCQAPGAERWTARRERELTKELTDAAPGGLTAAGLPECLGAVNAEAVALLLVPDEGMVPGFECGRCGALSLTGDDCPDWGTAARVVPDLLEEMARRCLDGGGQVVSVSDAPVSAAARLRFPVQEGADR